jgi:anaerobic selenocysteine-containing dehydrogenase
LLSSHLETGHYFNPHAQRIMEAKERGAKVCVIETRLSNTASKADYWLSTWPGTEAAVLLAMANVILREDSYDRDFLRRWVNWEEFLLEEHPSKPRDLDTFIATLKEIYSVYTPEFAERESGADARTIVEVAHEIARARPALATHVWRNAAAGGWQVARALEFLVVLCGAVGTPVAQVPT